MQTTIVFKSHEAADPSTYRTGPLIAVVEHCRATITNQALVDRVDREGTFILLFFSYFTSVSTPTAIRGPVLYWESKTSRDLSRYI